MFPSETNIASKKSDRAFLKKRGLEEVTGIAAMMSHDQVDLQALREEKTILDL
ncbi:MAG: hypothetical protein ACJAVK_001111 [Akkermansiaceae bacterium]